MASRRVLLVACVVTTALLGASPIGAATRASSFAMPRAASAVVHALASTVVAPAPGGPQADSLCWERDYTDPVGDAPIDATAYRLTYDCQSQTWRLGATLAAPVQPAAFDSLAIEIDTDNEPNDGCAGFDVLAAGAFGANNVPKGVLVATPTCDPNTWTTVGGAGFSAAGTDLGLSFSEHALADAPRLIWNAGVVPRDPEQPVDSLPDQGVLVAGEFLPATSAHDGYWLVDAAGGVHAYGNAGFHGDLDGRTLAQPIVSMARNGDRDGYWLLGRDGGVFTFGNAHFYGSTGALRLNQPVVSMATTRNCDGYWFGAADGGIFSFGNAHFYGSTGALRLNQPVVAMAATPSGHGYWLVASDGGIFAFGDAHFYGSTGARHLNQPIVGMQPTPSGHGYWLVAADGGIFAFGDAHFYGSTGGIHLVSPIVGMRASTTGYGYRFAAADGGIFGFGDASFLGGLGGVTPPSPIVGMG
jgi:hypothetical protein